MFDSIRNHKKYLMGFLMILIIPSFVLFGIEGYTRFNESGAPVAVVDGKDITKAEWDATPEIGRFARIHDPEGNPIELWEPASSPA